VPDGLLIKVVTRPTEEQPHWWRPTF